jgi:hypothetical protein
MACWSTNGDTRVMLVVTKEQIRPRAKAIQ